MHRSRTSGRAQALLLCLGLAVCSPVLFSQTSPPFNPKSATEGNLIFRDSERWISERFKWFREQRLLPGETVPEGLREQAWMESKAMDVYRPRVAMSKSTGLATWVLAGPQNVGGRITGVAIHPTNPSIAYFTAADGGIWKTTDGGDELLPIADDLPTMAMGAIDIDPRNPDIIYVGTGEANGSLDCYPGVGVVKSTNAGATWFLTGGTFASNIAMIRVHRTNGNVVLAATRTGMFRSTNAGTSWAKVRDGLAFDVMYHPATPNIAFGAIQGVGVVKSVDTGATWTTLNVGVAADSIGRIGIDLCRTQPNIMYAVIVSAKGTSNLKAIVKTTDGGNTWVKTSNASTPNFFSSYGWYLVDIAVDPSNPNRILSGGVGLYMSTDGGYVWSARSGLHVDQHAIEFSPSDNKVVYIGNDGGFYKSTNSGSTYTSLNDNLPISQFYELGIAPQDVNLMGGGMQDNGSWAKRNASPSWTSSTGGDGGYYVFDPINSMYQYTEYQNGSHMRTTNGGQTWSGANTGLIGSGQWVTPVAINPVNPTILFTATTKQLYKSTNRGASWFAFHGNMDSSSSINYIAVSPKNPDLMLVGFNSGRICRSTNAGATWTTISGTLPGRKVAELLFDPNESDTYYVCFSGNTRNAIYRTKNAGATWTDISGNLPSTSKNTIEINPNNPANLFAGTDLGVYATSDSGKTWAILGDGMPKVVIADLEMQPKTGMLIAATHGRSVYQLSVTTPVEFSAFSASLEGASVRLTWKTSVETNNAGFAVERLAQPFGSWQEVGFVAGRGTSGSVNVYTYIDTPLPQNAESLIYRLKQIDTDGAIDYSPEVLVALQRASASGFALEQNYPNPFGSASLSGSAVTTIRYTLGRTAQVRLTVTDATGRVFATVVDDAMHAGHHAVSFDATDLGTGAYFVHLVADGARLTRKMTVIK
ncbi:MAG: hypothetical protein IPP94_17695 [Ignavibacteria bacterium]|nr:hypothetical protein [Ignavibacteria bacterium]